MRVLGRDKLANFSKRHANAKRALDIWFEAARQAVWKTPRDIKQQYSSADFLAGNRVIFNVKGNHFRLVTEVNYVHGKVAIEWVGTHAEYDKQNFR